MERVRGGWGGRVKNALKFALDEGRGKDGKQFMWVDENHMEGVPSEHVVQWG